jgi:T5orf172 domain
MPHQYVSRDFPTTRRSGFRPPLPYVVRNGRYHYFRRPGLSRTRLPGLPFWPQYMAAYNAAYQQAFPDRVTPTPCTPPPPTQQPSSPTARRISYVYIIGESRDGPVKIGVSTNPKGRLSELQTGTPVKLKVLAKFRGDEEQEAFAHRLLGAHRINGEWFARTPAVNAFIDNVRRGVSVAGMVIDPALEFNEWDEVLTNADSKRQFPELRTREPSEVRDG